MPENKIVAFCKTCRRPKHTTIKNGEFEIVCCVECPRDVLILPKMPCDCCKCDEIKTDFNIPEIELSDQVSQVLDEMYSNTPENPLARELAENRTDYIEKNLLSDSMIQTLDELFSVDQEKPNGFFTIEKNPNKQLFRTVQRIK